MERDAQMMTVERIEERWDDVSAMSSKRRIWILPRFIINLVFACLLVINVDFYSFPTPVPSSTFVRLSVPPSITPLPLSPTTTDYPPLGRKGDAQPKPPSKGRHSLPRSCVFTETRACNVIHWQWPKSGSKVERYGKTLFRIRYLSLSQWESLILPPFGFLVSLPPFSWPLVIFVSLNTFLPLILLFFFLSTPPPGPPFFFPSSSCPSSSNILSSLLLPCRRSIVLFSNGVRSRSDDRDDEDDVQVCGDRSCRSQRI